MQPVLKFKRNDKGRDFVVGDIHGAFDLVLRAMKRAAFDPAVDRLFAVGDLFDRGSGSHRCVKFLAQPYVHSVRGNHESMLLDLYANGEPDQAMVSFMVARNGLGWWLSTPPAQRAEILEAISHLPLAIEIETARGTVGIIHADVPSGMSWDTFLARLTAGDSRTIETCLWGRDRIRSRDEQGVPGVGRVFVGHTPQWQGLKRYGNVYALDTGAVFGEQGTNDGGRLTMAGIVTKTESLVARCEAGSLVDLRYDRAEPVMPFGCSLLSMPET